MASSRYYLPRPCCGRAVTALPRTPHGRRSSVGRLLVQPSCATISSRHTHKRDQPSSVCLTCMICCCICCMDRSMASFCSLMRVAGTLMPPSLAWRCTCCNGHQQARAGERVV